MTSAVASRRLLEPGERLPAAVLHPVDGRPVDLHDLRHDSIVAVVCHPGCADCADLTADLDRAAGDLRAWDALPAAIVTDRDDACRLAADLSLTVLVDDGGRARAGIGVGAEGGAVLVADRFGTVYRIDPLRADHRRPSVAELETEARYVAIQCPECSVPAWSW
ncbi:MAG TPA: hypothetical protein VIK95_16000 [Egibacteraceae bacterium]